ncbi:uncharacterized protein [Primulina huaijiensis]|uniref:uncharacterized protein n=1 Tax=Primulina huaijiensis TaxID=1492673 RepID=UPI003CC6F475
MGYEGGPVVEGCLRLDLFEITVIRNCGRTTLAGSYPRGNKELRGSFFDVNGPMDTMSWFSERRVELKTEEDGRVFPISNSSSTIIDCLMSEAKKRGGRYCTALRQIVTSLILRSGYNLAIQLGHSIVKPVPSLFTFKIDDFRLAELSGITFPTVRAKLKLETVQKSIPEPTQIGPMLVTHWGLSGPVILRLSAWGARELSDSDYKG